MILFPGAAISLAVFAFNLFGDSLATIWTRGSRPERLHASLPQIREAFRMRKLLIAVLADSRRYRRGRGAALSDPPHHRDRPARARGTDRHDRPHRDGRRAATILGQNIIIENVGGASGTIGTGRVCAPILMATRSASAGRTTTWSMPRSTRSPTTAEGLRADLVLANGPMIIMSRNSLPAKNLTELIAWLKASGDNVTFGTGGLASPPHSQRPLAPEVTGTKFQFVPFRGSGPAFGRYRRTARHIVDQASRRCPSSRAATSCLCGTAKQRLASAPDIPTMDEAGLPGFHVSIWQGYGRRRARRRTIIAKLNAAIAGALADPPCRSGSPRSARSFRARSRRRPKASARSTRPRWRNGRRSSRPRTSSRKGRTCSRRPNELSGHRTIFRR